MSTINHQKLRELAFALQRMDNASKITGISRNALAVCCAGTAG